jgi:hypothetical protein
MRCETDIQAEIEACTYKTSDTTVIDLGSALAPQHRAPDAFLRFSCIPGRTWKLHSELFEVGGLKEDESNSAVRKPTVILGHREDLPLALQSASAEKQAEVLHAALVALYNGADDHKDAGLLRNILALFEAWGMEQTARFKSVSRVADRLEGRTSGADGGVASRQSTGQHSTVESSQTSDNSRLSKRADQEEHKKRAAMQSLERHLGSIWNNPDVSSGVLNEIRGVFEKHSCEMPSKFDTIRTGSFASRASQRIVVDESAVAAAAAAVAAEEEKQIKMYESKANRLRKLLRIKVKESSDLHEKKNRLEALKVAQEEELKRGQAIIAAGAAEKQRLKAGLERQDAVLAQQDAEIAQRKAEITSQKAEIARRKEALAERQEQGAGYEAQNEEQIFKELDQIDFAQDKDDVVIDSLCERLNGLEKKVEKLQSKRKSRVKSIKKAKPAQVCNCATAALRLKCNCNAPKAEVGRRRKSVFAWK